MKLVRVFFHFYLGAVLLAVETLEKSRRREAHLLLLDWILWTHAYLKEGREH